MSGGGIFNTFNATFEFANVSSDFGRDILFDVARKEDAFDGGFAMDDSQASFEIGQLDIEPAVDTKARTHAIIDIFQFLGRAITCQNNLLMITH